MLLLFTRDQATTFEFHLDELADASPAPTLAMVDGAGGEVLAASTLTRDTTATTILEFVKRGSFTVRVTSATGFVRGRSYLFGDADTETPERRRITGIVGDRLKLSAPFFHDHAAGVAAVSTRVEVALNADTFDTPVRYGRARFTYSVDTVAKIRDVQFAVSEHCFRSSLREEQVGISDTAVQKRIAEGTDIVGMMALAEDILREDIGTRFEPFLIRGESQAYENAHRLKTLELLADPDRPTHRDSYAAQYEKALSIVLVEPTVDHDDDDAVGPDEQAFYAGRRWARR